MSVRYIVKKIKLPDKVCPHPLWPGEIVFKILDKNTGHLAFGCYTNYRVAKIICARKNFKDDPELIDI